MRHYFQTMAAILCILLSSILLLAGCQASASTAETTPSTAEVITSDAQTAVSTEYLLDMLEITLPDGMERQRLSQQQESLVLNGKKAGAIQLLLVDESTFTDILNNDEILRSLVDQAMEDVNMEDMEWWDSSSSTYGLYEYHMGKDGQEYAAYFLRGQDACYVVWFDQTLISDEQEKSIMESLHSEDITEELNIISTEEAMAALNEAMKDVDYTILVTLPAGMTAETVSDECTLYYMDGEVVGGCTTVHFEEGILPEVRENQELILSYLQENVMAQVSQEEFDAEITDEALITAVFSNDEETYTHYILYYGKLGTQNDLWFKTSVLDQQTAESILWSASMKY